MTFEEAGARFGQLQAQWRTGMLQPAQYQQMVAQLGVQDSSGRWWQLEPNSGQWMMWNGTQWVLAQQAAAMPQYVPQAAQQQRTMTVPSKQAGPAIWEGLASVLPGFVIEMLQRWPVYQKDPAALASFAVPSLLPGVLLPLVPTIGRVAAILLVLGCLGWLSWPLISQAGEILGNAKAVQSHAGRGLVGVSMLYLIPRIWKAGR
jgi:hypothetical protein